MEVKKLNFSFDSNHGTIVLRLPRLNVEPIKAKTIELFSHSFIAVQKQITALIDKLSTLFSEVFEATQRLNTRQRMAKVFSSLRNRRSGRLPGVPRKTLRMLIIISVIALGLFGVSKLIQAAINAAGSGNDQRIEIAGAKADVDINSEFSFPLLGSDGEAVSQIKYTIQNAELRDEIVVKGQRATAVKGRSFLILNLKIANEYNKAIEIDSRDYVRLTTNGNEDEKLAPDIHNDPVEVQAISTKLTRIGFPINDTDKDLKLHVGEINGDKQTVDLRFGR
jgi:hypothetical protein